MACPSGEAVLGRVARVDRGSASVLTTTGSVRARIPNRLLATQDTDQIPTVGDWVLISAEEIDRVLPRTSAVTRKVAGERTKAQVVAANVDVVFVVDDAGAAPKGRRIERYLALAWESGALPVVLLNKADATKDADSAIEHARVVSLGVDVHAVSARTGMGLESLAAHLAPGRTVVLIGPSGVGKSSLVNALRGDEAVTTQDVRSDGKGRHTTSYRELHRTEPGCAVAAAIDAGTLDPARFASWVKLQREVARVQDRRAGWERAQAGAQFRAQQRSYKMFRDLEKPRRPR